MNLSNGFLKLLPHLPKIVSGWEFMTLYDSVPFLDLSHKLHECNHLSQQHKCSAKSMKFLGTDLQLHLKEGKK